MAMNDTTFDHDLSNSPSSRRIPQRRVAISSAQRAALRRHAQANPTLRHRQLVEWFQSQFSHKISQGTISDSLSQRWAYLDTQTNFPADRRRERVSVYPELEKCLLAWFDNFESVDQDVGYGEDGAENATAVAGPTMDQWRRQAVQFWQSLECYADQEMPNFNSGWIDRFKRRHALYNPLTKARRPRGSARGLNNPRVDEVEGDVDADADADGDDDEIDNTNPSMDTTTMFSTVGPEGQVGWTNQRPRQPQQQPHNPISGAVNNLSETTTTPSIPTQKIGLDEALRAIRTLRNYEQQQPDVQVTILQLLKKHEQFLEYRKWQQQQRQSIADLLR